MTNRTLLSVVAFVTLQASALMAMNNKAESPILSDEQIVEVAITLNEGEIDDGKVAKSHAKAAEVKGFAKMMVDHHTDDKREIEKVAKDQKIKTEKSDLSKSLRDDAKNTNKDLKRQEKENFDKAYVDQQAAIHEKALATLSNVLIPQAKNPALKAHLEVTRKSVNEHLEKARSLQSQMAAK